MQSTISTGFIGLGAMGRHMVRHLLSRGFAVSVYDTSEKAIAEAEALGAHRCASVREVADRAEAVLVCLPTPDIVRSVALGKDGVIAGSAVRIYVDHSTTGPSIAREVAAGLAARGIVALDGPLAGGVFGAEAGTLSVMASGPRASYEKVEPLLQAFGRNVTYVGNEAGQGQVLKLINNMIVAGSLVAAAEAVLFGVKSGLNAETMLNVLNVSTSRSFVIEEFIGRRVLDRRFDIGFRLELMLKDLRLYVQESERVGAPSSVNALAKQAYELAAVSGLGGKDMSCVVELIEKNLGAKIARDG